MSFQVIGAGFPRTGTTSLKQALEILGFSPCYHMIEYIRDTSHLPFWVDKFQGKKGGWDQLPGSWEGIVDFPGSIFFPDLMESFPQAKVILTLRPLEDWYDSMRSTVLSTKKKAAVEIPSPEQAAKEEQLSVMRNLMWEEQFEGRKQDEAYMKERFTAHYAQVRALTPPEQLLEFRVEDGWEPLTDFLGVPLPEVDFPHLNRREDFRSVFEKAKQNQSPY